MLTITMLSAATCNEGAHWRHAALSRDARAGKTREPIEERHAMAYSGQLAEHVERILDDEQAEYEAKKMMGGLCYMVNDKMCVGISDNLVMARIDPELYEEALTRPGCQEMDFTGRPLRGFVFINPDEADDLGEWIRLCLDFNPRAKKSKRKP